MSRDIRIQSLEVAAFAPYGDVLEAAGSPDRIINQGLCGRFHDRAQIEIEAGRAGISIFKAELRTLPLSLDMLERHPLGSQAFLPMSMDPFLVIVAPDADGQPGTPLAFRTKPGQGINFHKGTWHGVLTPIAGSGLFAVVDRIGAGDNLEEHWFEVPWTVADGVTPA